MWADHFRPTQALLLKDYQYKLHAVTPIEYDEKIDQWLSNLLILISESQFFINVNC